MSTNSKIEKKCANCGESFLASLARQKFCSKKCSEINQRGRKMPHSAEWEKNRIAAVRAFSKKKKWAKGYSRPKEHTQPMIDGHKKYRESNPEKHREVCKKNLSKNKDGNLSKENSPNWKGGKVDNKNHIWRNENRERLTKFRDMILSRDCHKCKSCGSTKNLQVHHIIPVIERKDTAFLPMNGVTLCNKCHFGTDNFGGKISRREFVSGIGKTIAYIQTIPHCFQVYNTIGNYQWTENNLLVIFISELGRDEYNTLVVIHEYVEATLCKQRGIREEDITNFDLMFEEKRDAGLVGEYDEPGDDTNAPYHVEHVFATKVEKTMCDAMGLNWADYERTINAL